MTIRILLADDQAMVRAGFRMILEAESDFEVVGEAEDGLAAVAAGNALLAPSVTRRIIADYASRSVKTVRKADLDLLTVREREVLRLVATGVSNAELAAELYLGEGTVKTHISHILAKFGLRDRVQAVVFAYESGLV